MENPSSLGDASFTRSFDPFTSTSWQHRGRKPTVVRRSRRHRGRASLRKQERTDTGVIGNGRCAARRVPPLPQGSSRGTSEKEGGHGLRPCEDRRARVW
jgi:hypothetical protein